MERAHDRRHRVRPERLTDQDFSTARDAIVAAYMRRGMPSSGRNMSAIFTRLRLTLFHSGQLIQPKRPDPRSTDPGTPTFAEYGYGPDDDFQVEPPYESLHGELVIVVDLAPERRALTDAERAALADLIGQPRLESAVAVILNAPDLSGTGCLWRSTLNALGG